MSNVARVFDEQTNVNALHSLSAESKQGQNEYLPWATLTTGAMPLMMFQLRLNDGKMICFSYSDLHEVHCQDAGRVELYLYSMRKLVITIEGRHLRELAQWFSSAGVRWIQEADPRAADRPESEAEIVNVLIEEIAD